MSNDTELKPCPFCGSKVEISESEPSTARFNEGAVHFAVSCSAFNCEVMPRANLWQMSPEEAAKAWNTRADQQLVNELTELLGAVTQGYSSEEIAHHYGIDIGQAERINDLLGLEIEQHKE